VSAAPAPSVSASSAPGQAARWNAYPTPQLAGAEHCRVGAAVTFGPMAAGYPVVGFGPNGGLITWIADPSTLAFRRLTADGRAQGQPGRTTLTALQEPQSVWGIDGGYVIIVRYWNWQTHEARWYALGIDPNGMPMGAMVLLPVNGPRLDARRSPDGSQVRLSYPLVEDRSGTAAAGSGVQRIALKLAGPARLDVSRVDKPFDDEGTAEPSDEVRGEMRNGATPPPPAPGPRIYEAVPRPTLLRAHAGRELAPTPLSVEMRGMYMPFALSWSGTHFIYPHRAYGSRDATEAALVAIDCR
jgi:hypothetical protein